MLKPTPKPSSSEDLNALRELAPHLWPRSTNLRARVVGAVLCLLVAKIANVFVPLFYKHAVDALTPHGATLLVAPVAMILAYGLLRTVSYGLVLAVAFIVFDIVRQGAPVLSWHFITGFPEQGGATGGILPAIVGTLSLVTIAVGVALPFTPFGQSLGMVALPLPFFGWLVVILISYAVLAQIVKTWFVSKYGYN